MGFLMYRRLERIDDNDIAILLAVTEVFGKKCLGTRNVGGGNYRPIPIAQLVPRRECRTLHDHIGVNWDARLDSQQFDVLDRLVVRKRSGTLFRDVVVKLGKYLSRQCELTFVEEIARQRTFGTILRGKPA